jgi:signal transduction histidine kinase
MTSSRPRPTRDLIVDLVCVAVAALVALVAAGEAETSGRVTGDALFWELVLACAGCAALAWRRRHPVGVAVLLAPLAAVTDLATGAVLIAVFTVAAYRRWSVAVAVAALHMLTYVPYSIVRPDPELSVAGANTANVAVLSITVALGMALRSRRRMVASLRERAARAETDAAIRAERLRALERERIAREMHDVLAHRLSMVSLHAGALEIRPDLPTEDVVRTAGTIRASAHKALEDLREILGILRAGADDGNLPQQAGLADLDELIAERRFAGTPVEVDNRLPATPAPPAVGRTVYRIVQEGLTNAHKHAPGAQVHLQLDLSPVGDQLGGARGWRSPLAGKALHVRLRNRLASVPGPAIPGAHSGLAGLAERVSLVGGRLEHGARRGTNGEITFLLEAWLLWPT